MEDHQMISASSHRNEENIDTNPQQQEQQEQHQQAYPAHAYPPNLRHRPNQKQRRRHSHPSSQWSSSTLNHPAQTAKIIAESLQEPKIALIHRVVRTLGAQKTWKIFQETKFNNSTGSKNNNNTGTKTLGGLFFRLVKETATKEQYKIIYEIEVQKKKEAKKRIKFYKQKKMEKTIEQLDFHTLAIGSTGIINNQTRNFVDEAIDQALNQVTKTTTSTN